MAQIDAQQSEHVLAVARFRWGSVVLISQGHIDQSCSPAFELSSHQGGQPSESLPLINIMTDNALPSSCGGEYSTESTPELKRQKGAKHQ